MTDLDNKETTLYLSNNPGSLVCKGCDTEIVMPLPMPVQDLQPWVEARQAEHAECIGITETKRALAGLRGLHAAHLDPVLDPARAALEKAVELEGQVQRLYGAMDSLSAELARSGDRRREAEEKADDLSKRLGEASDRCSRLLLQRQEERLRAESAEAMLVAVREVADGRRHYDGTDGFDCFAALGTIRGMIDEALGG